MEEQKSFHNFVEETQQCPDGKYYCHDMKKCKPIPKGYHVGRGGWLKPDPDRSNMKTLTTEKVFKTIIERLKNVNYVKHG